MRAEPVLTAPFVRVLAANFCFFLNFASFFLLPLHIRALGGSERTIGFVMGMAGLSGLVSVLVAGWLLDRFGRRLFFLAGLATMAVSSVGYVLVDRVGPLLFALRGVQGLAFAMGFNASSTLAVEYAPVTRRATALGLFGVSTLTTHAIAPALGEILVRHAGFHALFVVAACCSVVGLAIGWPLDPPPLHLTRRPTPLRLGRLLLVAFATSACMGLAFGSVITYVPTFVHDAHLEPVGTFFLSYTGAAVLSRLFGGRLGDAFERRTVILPALTVMAVAITALAGTTTVPTLAAAAVVFGMAQGVGYPTLNAFTVDQVSVDQLGRVQTIFNGAFNLGVTGGSMALGPVAEAFGQRAAFRCAAGVMALGVVVFAAGTRGARARRAAVSLDSLPTGAD